MNPSLFILIFSGVSLNTAAQLLLKAGVTRMGQLHFSLNQLFPISFQAATNPFIFLGLVIYVVSVAIWIMVLSRVEVSYAYPMVSLGYVLNAITAYYLFGEHLTLTRITGIFIILIGVYFVARS